MKNIIKKNESFKEKFILKISFIPPFFLLSIINSLFIFKYVSTEYLQKNYIVNFLYVLIFIAIPYIYSKFTFKDLFYKYSFFSSIFLFFIFTIFINIYVDGNSLNVDRWSAMDVAIKALFEGRYPYSATDHLNGRTSNLPTLIFIGIPFYLLGSVGFLQSISFLIFSYIIYKVFKEYRIRLFCLFLLITSPSYLWEIYVKSDLMSNLILVLLFLFIVQKKLFNGKKININVLSFFSAALLLTRLTVIIPLTLLLFKKFYYFTLKEKFRFVLIALITIILFLFICFKNLESIANFKMYNPFNLQDKQLPTFISVILVLIPFVFSFMVKDFKSLMKYCTIFMAISIIIAFSLNIYKNGIYQSLLNSSFDISYFNFITPFLLIYITLIIKPSFQSNKANL